MNFSKKNHSLSAFGVKHNKSNSIFVSKNLITTIVLVVLTFSTASAQIKRPIISVNKISIKKSTIQGLIINSNTKLITITDFSKLKIPVAQATKEKLNAEPTRSWKITPMKLTDGFLKFSWLRGTAT